jgi:general L-amino acid transport system permease protein
VVGIFASFPLGVLLALGRRSNLPIVKWFCTIYIEVVRGVPLISVLFMSVLMLPLFLPSNIRVDNLVRVLVAITLFSAAYLAENVRGGLQSVPRGQEEAARALGLNVFQTMRLIVLPQALRAVIPAIVGQFISLFKDTSLVSIVGLAELLGIAGIVINQPDWLTVTGGVEREVLLFAALLYWLFCFSLSKISRRIEQNLGVGTR